MEGHPPLFYHMKKAVPDLITPATLYRGLVSAFTSNSIGPIANDASKCWNSDMYINGGEDGRELIRKCVARLTAYENWSID